MPPMPAIGMTASTSATRATSQAQARLLMYHLLRDASQAPYRKFDILAR
jgi:hypothetical protein